MNYKKNKKQTENQQKLRSKCIQKKQILHINSIFCIIFYYTQNHLNSHYKLLYSKQKLKHRKYFAQRVFFATRARYWW